MSQLTYHNKRVLIVDDQRPFLVMLRGVINTLGATSVVITQNADAALAECKKEKFDIIISDLHLGADKKNGFQLLEELRVRKWLKPETIYMMVSADAERPMVLGTIEKQPDDYLIKPFSQAQIANRISKAYAKRSALKPIYQKLMEDDVPGAVKACRELILAGSRYRQFCSVIMIELFWRMKRYDQALSLLTPLMDEKRLPWTVVAMAKTRMYMNQFNEAIRLAQDVVKKKNIQAADAYDVMAQCYLKTEQLEEACQEIKNAIDISPYSIERQYLGCEIARASGDYEFAKNCCQAILEQTRKSVYRNIAHLCTYIRSLLDAAEHAEDMKERNKYQQEAMLALQRNKTDDLLTRINEPFDYTAFESIVTARLNVIEGKMLEAKRYLGSSQSRMENLEEYPMALAPDSIKVMCDLGEFEQADELMRRLDSEKREWDPNTKHLLESTKSAVVQENKAIYQQHQNDGIAYLNEGKHEAAYEQFNLALKQAPMNTSVALNLLQCLIKLLEKNNKPDYHLVQEFRQTYRLVDGIHLPVSHQRKLASMMDDIKVYLRK